VNALGIFAQAPIPGRVKTRLAADVGPSAAAEVYGRVGRAVVAAVLGPGYRSLVWFTPAAEAAFVREWLDGLGRFELRPQGAGSLGTRLAAAFARHFRDGAGCVVIVGTDCPGVDRRRVQDAFVALTMADVVLGPALDGGCYLIGLRAPRLDLLRSVSWTAGSVAAQISARARALGLRAHTMPPLRDVDTERDARLLGLLKP
jgi:rSAM/selenodomain-associated transferase 1